MKTLTIMKRLFLIFGAAALLWGCGTTEFLTYSGAQQNWPTAAGAIVDTKLAIPVYYGLPPRPYRVLGEIVTSKPQGWRLDVQSQAMEIAVDEAKRVGADAIIVTSRDASITGYTTGYTATVVGNTAFGNGVTTAVQTAHVRVTAIKFV
jgi:hypothetical protein